MPPVPPSPMAPASASDELAPPVELDLSATIWWNLDNHADALTDLLHRHALPPVAKDPWVKRLSTRLAAPQGVHPEAFERALYRARDRLSVVATLGMQHALEHLRQVRRLHGTSEYAQSTVARTAVESSALVHWLCDREADGVTLLTRLGRLELDSAVQHRQSLRAFGEDPSHAPVEDVSAWLTALGFAVPAAPDVGDNRLGFREGSVPKFEATGAARSCLVTKPDAGYRWLSGAVHARPWLLVGNLETIQNAAGRRRGGSRPATWELAYGALWAAEATWSGMVSWAGAHGLDSAAWVHPAESRIEVLRLGADLARRTPPHVRCRRPQGRSA